jgi:hypothetical protein
VAERPALVRPCHDGRCRPAIDRRRYPRSSAPTSTFAALNAPSGDRHSLRISRKAPAFGRRYCSRRSRRFDFLSATRVFGAAPGFASSAAAAADIVLTRPPRLPSRRRVVVDNALLRRLVQRAQRSAGPLVLPPASARDQRQHLSYSRPGLAPDRTITQTPPLRLAGRFSADVLSANRFSSDRLSPYYENLPALVQFLHLTRQPLRSAHAIMCSTFGLDCADDTAGIAGGWRTGGSRHYCCRRLLRQPAPRSLRTVVIAGDFGTSPELGAYWVAFRLPDMVFQVPPAPPSPCLHPHLSRYFTRRNPKRPGGWQARS